MTKAVQSSLESQTALIIGGSSGIGLATAKRAQAAGATVTILGLEKDRTRQVAEENGFDDWRAADVTNGDSVQGALKNIPHVDHLAFFAGTFVAGKVLGADMSHLRRAFEERIWASLQAIRALGDRLAADGSINYPRVGMARAAS